MGKAWPARQSWWCARCGSSIGTGAHVCPHWVVENGSPTLTVWESHGSGWHRVPVEHWGGKAEIRVTPAVSSEQDDEAKSG